MTAPRLNDAPKHDALVLAEAVRICTDEFKTLRNNKSASARLEGVILEHSPSFPTLTFCARLLGMTPRTLQRHLAAEKVRFVDLRDQVRHGRACALLRDNDLPFAAIAEQLGFADVANFYHAFRRWEGCAPGEYRKSLV